MSRLVCHCFSLHPVRFGYSVQGPIKWTAEVKQFLTGRTAAGVSMLDVVTEGQSKGFFPKCTTDKDKRKQVKVVSKFCHQFVYPFKKKRGRPISLLRSPSPSSSPIASSRSAEAEECSSKQWKWTEKKKAFVRERRNRGVTFKQIYEEGLAAEMFPSGDPNKMKKFFFLSLFCSLSLCLSLALSAFISLFVLFQPDTTFPLLFISFSRINAWWRKYGGEDSSRRVTTAKAAASKRPRILRTGKHGEASSAYVSTFDLEGEEESEVVTFTHSRSSSWNKGSGSRDLSLSF